MVHHESRLQWKEALRHMEAALEALDAADAPSVVGSHLDLAICRLRDLIGRSGVEIAGPRPQSL